MLAFLAAFNISVDTKSERHHLFPLLKRQVNLIPVREKREVEERMEEKLPLVMVESPGCSGDPQDGLREKDWILHPPNF